MEFPQPERSRGKEKALHLAAAIVENARPPPLVLTLIGVCVFVAGRTVEVDEAVLVLAEVRGHPVKENGDPLAVQVVDKVHKILGRSVARRRGKIAGTLVAPGIVERILRHGHELHAVVAKIQNIVCQLVGKRAVIVKITVLAPPP